MAIFDPQQQRMCVRIVYDGAAGTGKTTNLASLCRLLATQQTTELYSPGEIDGRTLYFDWVQVLTGVVCGFPVMCQIISVPGQTVLTPRRRHLLSTADAVVLVCDSTPAGIERARDGLTLVDEMARQHGRQVPLVVQANKQDQVSALTGAVCLEQLGRPEAPVVEAIATEGIGVLDTFMAAFRAVSRAMQAASERDELHVSVGRAPVAADVLRRLDQETLDPEWAAEMFLEELQASFLAGGDFRGDAHVGAKGESNGERRDDEPPITRRSAPPLAVPLAPDHEVEAGFVWPAHTGRQVLTALSEAYGSEAGDRRVTLDADGKAALMACGYVLRTARSERFSDREEARQALVRAARERTKLDGLLPPDTVLAAQAATDGALWLWTLTTTMPTLVELDTNAGEAEQLSIRRRYVIALVDAVGIWLRHGFALRLDPLSFGMSEGMVRYLGPLGGASDEEALGAAVNAAIAAVTRLGWDVSGFLASFEQELHVRLTREEVTRASAVTGFPSSPGPASVPEPDTSAGLAPVGEVA